MDGPRKRSRRALTAAEFERRCPPLPPGKAKMGTCERCLVEGPVVETKTGFTREPRSVRHIEGCYCIEDLISGPDY